MTGVQHGVKPTEDGAGAIFTFAWATPPITANGQRGHWSVQARRVREVREISTALARLARTPARAPLRLQRAVVDFTWFPTVARRRDAHNLVPLLKPLIDGLVAGGVIPDDNDDVLDARMPRIVLQPAGPARFELTIRPTEGDHQ